MGLCVSWELLPEGHAILEGGRGCLWPQDPRKTLFQVALGFQTSLAAREEGSSLAWPRACQGAMGKKWEPRGRRVVSVRRLHFVLPKRQHNMLILVRCEIKRRVKLSVFLLKKNTKIPKCLLPNLVGCFGTCLDKLI